MGAQATITGRVTGTTLGLSTSDVDYQLMNTDDWTDLVNYQKAIFTIHVLSCSLSDDDTAQIIIATAADKRAIPIATIFPPEGPLAPVGGADNIAANEWYKSYSTFEYAGLQGDFGAIDRWILWIAAVSRGSTGSGGRYDISFEILITAKDPG